MKLSTMPNNCALAAHIVIKWTGLDIDDEVMSTGASRQSPYLAVNPHAKVPMLRLDSGEILTEMSAILPLLAELAPETPLGGHDQTERTQLSEALAFMIGEVHSDWTPHFAASRNLSDEADFPKLEQATFERLAPQYAFMEEELGQNRWFLFGCRTIADAYFYMLARTAGLIADGLNPYPRLAAFRARLEADAGVIAALVEQDFH
jgi:glutathione S-transferase